MATATTTITTTRTPSWTRRRWPRWTSRSRTATCRRPRCRRRGLLRSAGILGGTAALAVTGAQFAAAAAPKKAGWIFQQGKRPNVWLAGDHHIHTQLSSDGMYRVIDQARHAAAFGLDWLVITDHGGATHARIGVDLVNPQIKAARAELKRHPDLPGAGVEHPGRRARHGLRRPGQPRGRGTEAVREQLRRQREERRREHAGQRGARGRPASSGSVSRSTSAGSQDALFLANHPARNGIDSPHEIRNWRDADPRIAVGFEGAPGHQAAGLPHGHRCRAAPVASTATRRARTPSPATRPRATGPGAASTG